MTGRDRTSRPERAERPKRPYAEFAEDVYPTLVAEVGRFAASVPGGLPVGFDVRDFVQHALLSLTDLYDQRPNEPAAYVYARTSATNALLDAVRAAERRQEPRWLAGVAAAHGGGMTPDEAAERAARRRAVQAALSRLPPNQQQVVRLLYMEGFRRKEAARIMGLSPEAVKSLAQRARATLVRALKGMPAVIAVHAACRRLRRPASLAVATAPRVAAVLCLTVAQTPVMVSAPHAEAYAEPAHERPERRPDVAAPLLTAPPAQAAAPSATVRLPAPSVVRPPRRGVVPPPPKVGPPKAGGCVGETCVGSIKEGDEVCVDAVQERPPACANQSVVGVCPTTDRLAVPRTRCTRHSEPALDP